MRVSVGFGMMPRLLRVVAPRVRRARHETARKGRDHSPDVVTLANYRSHIGRVVTFEGKVRSVQVSRRGSDYAVMFEHTAWQRELKLVFFRGTVAKVGGAGYIRGLNGRHVRVRGLLV
jgi:hypothetical protein